MKFETQEIGLIGAKESSLDPLSRGSKKGKTRSSCRSCMNLLVFCFGSERKGEKVGLLKGFSFITSPFFVLLIFHLLPTCLSLPLLMSVNYLSSKIIVILLRQNKQNKILQETNYQNRKKKKKFKVTKHAEYHRNRTKRG